MSHGRFQNVGDRPKAHSRERDSMFFVIERIPGGDTIDDIAKNYNFENKGQVRKSIVPVSNPSWCPPVSVQVGNLENVYLLKFQGDESQVKEMIRVLKDDDSVREGIQSQLL